MPGLKPIARDKLLFTVLHSVQKAVVDINNGAYCRLCNPVNSSLPLALVVPLDIQT
jgi:hypothetical protein